MSVFEQFRPAAYPYRFGVTLRVDELHGGVPNSNKAIEGWLRSKFLDNDAMIRQMVTETMAERGVEMETAIEEVATDQHVNGFKRTPEGVLYIEGRQVKAGLKEAASVAATAGKIKERGWGHSQKGVRSFLAEHLFVPEKTILLGVTEPTATVQRFVQSRYGAAIQVEEVVRDVEISFTVKTDMPLTEEEWAHIWLTGENQGLGAARSQGFGTYEVVRFEALPTGGASSNGRSHRRRKAVAA